MNTTDGSVRDHLPAIGLAEGFSYEVMEAPQGMHKTKGMGIPHILFQEITL